MSPEELAELQEFQSTLPREERPGRAWRMMETGYFNPRSHERSDKLTKAGVDLAEDFNPRSHERSDCTAQRSCRCSYNFNPRSHERSDASFLFHFSLLSISIHAPTRGATY